MSKSSVLLIAPLHPTLMAFLESQFTLLKLWKEENKEAFLQTQGASVDYIACTIGHVVNKALLDQLPHLKAVFNYGVGYDSIDIDTLQKRGIPLCNTPQVLNDCVADIAVALCLGVAREVVKADHYVRSGQWATQRHYHLTSRVNHQKVGILGLGSIGLVVAKRMQAFDCEIAYHNRHQRSDVDFRYFDNAVDLAKWADFLFVVTVGGEGTKHLVNRDVLDALGSNGFLINVARGSVVDETALIEALKNKTIAGAGLDVYNNEPKINPEFFTLENTVLQPHIASATIQTREIMAQLVIQNIQSFLSTGKFITPVI